MSVEVLERHPRSAQAFFALDGVEALVVVAPPLSDGMPDLRAARAFRAPPATPFLYAPGVWHAPLFALERPGRFLMAMGEHGAGEDCETQAISPTLLVHPARQDDGITG